MGVRLIDGDDETRRDDETRKIYCIMNNTIS